MRAFLGEFFARAVPTPDAFYPNAAMLLGRVFTVIALLPNGARKIATFAQTAAGMGGEKQLIDGRVFPDQTPLFLFPLPELFLGFSVVFDLLGAVLIILGVRTRAVGFLLAGYVTLAMAIYHSDIRHMGDAVSLLRNLAFLGALLMLSVAGGGWWSIDGALAKRRR